VLRPSFEILPVRTPSDLEDAIKLIRAYVDRLGLDLSFQDFDAEMAAMPGKYAPPAGELLLARSPEGLPIGCVGLRPLAASGCCEMKRLYVAGEARGAGLGEALMRAALTAAERIGYREMRLDTLPGMSQALALYRKHGFSPIAPYYDNPVRGAVFMSRKLSS
jgi:ribosomal protein S18 acetylase RimI-like enzyme